MVTVNAKKTGNVNVIGDEEFEAEEVGGCRSSLPDGLSPPSNVHLGYHVDDDPTLRS